MDVGALGHPIRVVLESDVCLIIVWPKMYENIKIIKKNREWNYTGIVV
jgi:hypothetical protein